MNRLLFTTAPFAFVALVLSSCAYPYVGTISPTNGVTIATIPHAVIPSGADGASAIVPIGTDLVYVHRDSSMPGQLRLTRVTRSGETRWSTVPTLPADVRDVPWTEWPIEVLGDASEGQEVLLHLFERGGRISLVSSRVNDGTRVHDTGYVIARQFDASSGEPIASRLVYSASGDAPQGAWMSSAIAPDSSSFVISHVMFDSVDRSLDRHELIVAGFDGTIERRAAFSVDGEEFGKPHVYLGSDGAAYLVGIEPPRTVVIHRSGRAGDASTTRFAFDTPSDPGTVDITGFHGWTEGDGALVLVVEGRDGRYLTAVQLVRLAPGRDIDARPVLELGSRLTQSLIDDDGVDWGTIAQVVGSTTGAARHVVIAEERKFRRVMAYGSARPPAQAITEDVILLAFDEAGRPTWQRGIVRSSGVEFETLWQFNSAAAHVNGDTLELVLREDETMVVRRHHLTDGRPLTPPAGIPILALNEYRGIFSSSIRWIAPSTIVAVGKTGDRAVYIIDYSGASGVVEAR
ncbi:MAG TPA: hypothetical protein VNA88_09570 [Candidatus Kapabacteria bacterium]|nr:hypothetical protein [Candidatus Kapabacteria bacterium]